MRDTSYDMAQTVRHLGVLTDFVALKWHDLARHIAGIAGTKFVPVFGLLYSNSRQMTPPVIYFDSLTGFTGLHGISTQTDNRGGCSNLVTYRPVCVRAVLPYDVIIITNIH